MSIDNGAKNSKQTSTILSLVDLSPERRRLLETLINPEHSSKKITKICEIAAVDRGTYYKAIANDDFNEIYEDYIDRSITAAVGPIVNEFIRRGKKGEFKHGETILKMSGKYIEVTKQQIEAQVTTEVTAKIEADVRAKVEQELNVYGNVLHHEIEYDLSNLTDEELENLEKIQRKLNDTKPTED